MMLEDYFAEGNYGALFILVKSEVDAGKRCERSISCTWSKLQCHLNDKFHERILGSTRIAIKSRATTGTRGSKHTDIFVELKILADWHLKNKWSIFEHSLQQRTNRSWTKIIMRKKKKISARKKRLRKRLKIILYKLHFFQSLSNWHDDASL